jgi:hypothetical protein
MMMENRREEGVDWLLGILVPTWHFFLIPLQFPLQSIHKINEFPCKKCFCNFGLFPIAAAANFITPPWQKSWARVFPSLMPPKNLG